MSQMKARSSDESIVSERDRGDRMNDLLGLEASPCFFDGSGHLRCLASDASENSTSDAPENPNIGILRFPENRSLRRFGSPEIRKSGHSDSPKSGFSEIGFLKFRETEDSDFRMFRFSGFSGNREI